MKKEIEYIDLISALVVGLNGAERDIANLRKAIADHKLDNYIFVYSQADITHLKISGDNYHELYCLIEIKDMEIYLGEHGSANSILNSDSVAYQNNKIGIKIENCNITAGEKSDQHFELRAYVIDIVDNKINLNSGFRLHARKVAFANNEIRGGLTQLSPLRYNTGSSHAQDSVILSNNYIAMFHPGTPRQLDIIGKNTIEEFIPQAEVIGRCYIEPKLKIGYQERNLIQHKKVFIDLLGRAVDLKDVNQQRILEKEVARIDYHIYRSKNRHSIREWPDIAFRTIPYVFKLQFYDRHYSVRFLLGLAAFLLFFMVSTSTLTSAVFLGCGNIETYELGTHWLRDALYYFGYIICGH